MQMQAFPAALQKEYPLQYTQDSAGKKLEAAEPLRLLLCQLSEVQK